MTLADLVATQIIVVPISAVPGVSFRSAPTVLTGFVECDDALVKGPAGGHGTSVTPTSAIVGASYRPHIYW